MSKRKRAREKEQKERKKQQERSKKAARQQHDPAKWEAKKAAKAKARHEAGLY